MCYFCGGFSWNNSQMISHDQMDGTI